MPKIRIGVGSNYDYKVRYHPIDLLTKDIFGKNAGNIMFQTATTLAMEQVGETKVVAGVLQKKPEIISEEFDVLVLPWANALQPAFVHGLRLYAEYIRKLKNVRVFIVGVGAQATLDEHPNSYGGSHRSDMGELISAVLDSGGDIGVRGSFTQELLQSLGFGNIQTIGCPSLSSVSSLKPQKIPGNIEGWRSLFSLQESHLIDTSEILRMLLERGRVDYIAQDYRSLQTLIFKRDMYHSQYPEALPFKKEHQLFVSKAVHFPLDAFGWINLARGADLYFGPRIHGAIAATLAGVPSVLVAHDWRTKELAEYHGIPTISVKDAEHGLTIDQLLSAADNKVPHRLTDNFDNFHDFLIRNQMGPIDNSHNWFELESGQQPVSGFVFDNLTLSQKEYLEKLRANIYR